jgi:hypothetical protein
MLNYNFINKMSYLKDILDIVTNKGRGLHQYLGKRFLMLLAIYGAYSFFTNILTTPLYGIYKHFLRPRRNL